MQRWFPIGPQTRRLAMPALSYAPLIVLLGVIGAGLEGVGIGLIMPLLNAMTGQAPAAGGRFVAFFLNVGAGMSQGSRILVLGGLIVGLVVVRNLFAGGGAILGAWVYGKASAAIRSGLAGRLTEVGFPFFIDQRPGRLLNILATESWRAADAIATGLAILTNLSAALILFVFLWLLSWRLTLAVAVGLCLVQLAQAAGVRPLRRMSRRLTEHNGELASLMLHLIEGARLIRVFARGASEVRRVSEASGRVKDAFYRLERRKALVPPAMEALYGVLFVAVIIGAALAGQTFSLIAAFVVLLYRMQPQVRAMQSGMAQLHAISGSLAAVEWLLEPEGKPHQASGATDPGRLARGIRFENVTYGYGAGAARPPVLREVSCEFRAGRSTALVGRSGAGKSTVVDLLCRLDEPDAGAIWIDDRPLAEVDTNAWRSRIAVASEQIELVEGSVAENIAYGCPTASREAVIHAAGLADAHDFIASLPEGYDTALGSGGALLSSGQGQRIALARALLRDPEVLILDEATNALDGISERAVVEALASRAGRATTIVVSHHRKALHLCDDVVLLEDGQVRTSVSIHRLAEGEVEDLYREGSATSAQAHPSPGRVDGTLDPRDH